MTHYRGNYDVR